MSGLRQARFLQIRTASNELQVDLTRTSLTASLPTNSKWVRNVYCNNLSCTSFRSCLVEFLGNCAAVGAVHLTMPIKPITGVGRPEPADSVSAEPHQSFK